MDWSYELLAPGERVLLQRLSVFNGSWSLIAAETVCADAPMANPAGQVLLPPPEVLDTLTRLVNKSLVVVELGNDLPRYHMLETIRQYGLGKLQETGDETELRNGTAPVTWRCCSSTRQR